MFVSVCEWARAAVCVRWAGHAGTKTMDRHVRRPKQKVDVCARILPCDFSLTVLDQWVTERADRMSEAQLDLLSEKGSNQTYISFL